MNRHFENIDVECWEERSRLGTARPAICLFHAERTLGREILAALEELATERQSPSGLSHSSHRHEIMRSRLSGSGLPCSTRAYES